MYSLFKAHQTSSPAAIGTMTRYVSSRPVKTRVTFGLGRSSLILPSFQELWKASSNLYGGQLLQVNFASNSAKKSCYFVQMYDVIHFFTQIVRGKRSCGPRRVVHEARGRPDATVANELAGGHHLARGSRAPHSDRLSKARSPKRRANFADFGNTQAQRRQY